MKFHKQVLFLLLICCTAGCGEAFLDLKPNQSQRIPSTVADYQAMLDNTNLFNMFSCHALGIIGSDEYYMLDTRYETFQTGLDYNFQKRAYIWNANIYEGGENNTDWSRAYLRILQANIVLDGLKKLAPSTAELNAFNLSKGSALFYRAMTFYSLAQLYCKPYNAATSDKDLGLPLRLEADVTLKTDRSTVAKTYQQIINDLDEAASLLSGEPKVLYRPSKAAVYALLSRVYLQLGDYTQAASKASNALQIKNTLLDLNTMILTARYVFPANGTGNPEVLFYSSADNITTVSTSNLNISTDIISSYSANDLRKKAYLFTNTDGRILFKGGYTGSPSLFTGLATDEVLLNRAECYARLGKVNEALADLNELAKYRYDKNSFVAFSVGSAVQALELIISERKKELIFRGLRWEDLRRLNKEPEFSKTLKREIRGQGFELLPGAARYTWPIPLEAIASGGYEQNSRNFN